jgi:formate dehydrogenase major subunit
MLAVDGRQTAAEGSVLDAILALGIALPHLCKDDNLPAIGACRTCLVEADGRVVAACSLPAAGVNRVETDTERVVRLRRAVLQLTLAMQSSPGDGLVRGPLGRELQVAAAHEGSANGRFEARARGPVDGSNPFFEFDEGACILCGRCTTACQALQHIGAIGMAGRGIATAVTPGSGVSFLDSICTSCGSCVAACPTHALRPKQGGL